MPSPIAAFRGYQQIAGVFGYKNTTIAVAKYATPNVSTGFMQGGIFAVGFAVGDFLGSWRNKKTGNKRKK